MSALVAYFTASSSRATEKVAKRLSETIGADLYQIQPEVPYTRKDLNWMKKDSRSSLEMKDPDARPALKDMDAPVESADTVYIGFPVWWYREPSVIDTFVSSYDFKGKKIFLFATSGSSDIGTEAPARIEEITGVPVAGAMRFSSHVSADKLRAWAAQ